MPVTRPEASTDACPLLPLQEPPGVRSARVIVAPGHTFEGPVMPAGFALTVTLIAALQPAGATNV